MKLSRDFLRLSVIPLVLMLGILLTAAFTIFYTVTAKTQDGKLVSSDWPKDFTLSFSQYINLGGSAPSVSDEGKALLAKQELWLQILDDEGSEVFKISAPASLPRAYRPYEFLQLYQNGFEDYTVFVSSIESDAGSYTYLIGFPLSISKAVMYVDTARYNSGKALIIATAVLTLLLIIALTVYYNVVITKSLGSIRRALKSVAARSYAPKKGKRFLREIFDGIDTLNSDIEAADRQRALDEKAREEWLSNINHDLKTPLAPIRGYAELLSEEEQSAEAAQRYGGIILKNALYAQQLVDDLKLTYQLQSGMLPLKKERRSISRFVKELIIDLLNSPEYEGRSISFSSDCEELMADFDPRLLRRALLNILVNALKHNKPDTDIAVSLTARNGIALTVADSGSGMTEAELAGLFTRYYRGTGSDAKSEGSGLGMAIAKQIVEAHGGEIFAESTVGVGTTISIKLPQQI